VSSGVADMKQIFERARKNLEMGKRTVLFVDEIHRFNRAQQDALLPVVEDGTVILIGATTENPSFEVITPLLSRCQVYVLKSLGVKDLDKLLQRALTEDIVLREKNIEVVEKDALFRYSSGDARKLLNILEIITSDISEGEKLVITDKLVAERLQENIAIYDKNGEQHYDIISAFIKKSCSVNEVNIIISCRNYQ
jgi:putative ATPase